MENTLMVSESVPPQTAGDANPYQPGSRLFLLMDQGGSSNFQLTPFPNAAKNARDFLAATRTWLENFQHAGTPPAAHNE